MVRAMILYPAIDLKDGRCVRLFQGDYEKVTVYNESPADQARAFADAGFSWLHIVDLDGAAAGAPANARAVREIVAAAKLPVQLGGGIRTLGQIRHWLDAGVTRVILGTAAVRTPELMREACEIFPGKIVLGLDTRGDHVAIEGWKESVSLTAADLAREFGGAGIAAIIHTDIARDGTGEGVNLESTRALARLCPVPVIASGGVGSLDDLRAVKAAEGENVQGVIVGRALYDGRVSAADALKIAAEG